MVVGNDLAGPLTVNILVEINIVNRVCQVQKLITWESCINNGADVHTACSGPLVPPVVVVRPEVNVVLQPQVVPP